MSGSSSVLRRSVCSTSTMPQDTKIAVSVAVSTFCVRCGADRYSGATAGSITCTET